MVDQWLRLRFLLVAALLGLTACSSLPKFVPDLARRPGPPVQLEGARGPLSAAQSKAILKRLAGRGQDTGIFERHLAVEEAIVGSPLTTGNDVRLLQDGPATYQAMHAAILAAQDHINLETYILDDDEVGQRFAQIRIVINDQNADGIAHNRPFLKEHICCLRTVQAMTYPYYLPFSIPLKFFS